STTGRARKLYFEALNTPTLPELIGEYMPENVEKRYYRKHANILAAYFGIPDSKDEAKDILRRTLNDDSLGEFQPYFAHFALEAVLRNGLREEFTLSLLEKWKAPARECSKGLAEGFIPPEPTYKFDHSHAWGGTPLYSLPMALTGLEIIEPAYKKIKLDPSILGLKYATVEIPTPYGSVKVEQSENGVKITSPAEVEII
ncbi:MAG: hypothetical protein MJ072_04665, partial [Clostridia bacterium]|nr:hypothetical protein [Clostridia bacterium]